jgi:hypothetical protein
MTRMHRPAHCVADLARSDSETAVTGRRATVGRLLVSLRYAIVIAFAVLAACDGPTETQPYPLPSDAVEFSAPAIYRVWWSEVERCSARTGSFSSLRWYVSPREQLALGDKEFVNGWYDHGGRRIVVTAMGRYSGETVRHEMLDALLGAQRGHPRDQFLERCAEFVGCGPDCVQEAGPAAPASPLAVRVRPDTLQLDLTTANDTVRQGDDNAFVRATILVTNPLNQWIVVDATSPDAGPPPSFGYSVIGLSSGFGRSDRVWDPTTLRFAPRETKRWQLDFKASELSLGVNTITGGFATRQTPAVRVVISP